MPEIRPATPQDAPAMYALVKRGFDGYAEFMPDGWRGARLRWGADDVAERLAWPDSWARLAVDGDRLVGFVSFLQARTEEEPRERIEGLAHLWQLFVERDWWGTGLARELLAMAHDEIRARGYTCARLWTPKLQARARAFYERGGWYATDVETYSDDLDAELVQYRLDLG